MHNNFNEEYQYDSCISRGICSINPRISALQTVLVLYLRILAKYSVNLELSKKIKSFILNTLSITINNPEFNENSYLFAVENFRKELPSIVQQALVSDSNIDIESEKNKFDELFKETEDIIQAIKFGEKIFNSALENIPAEIRDLYNIILVIAKSLSINLLDLESFNKESEIAFKTILDLLGKINLEENDIEKLKFKIVESVKLDCELMKLIRQAQQERYGKQGVSEVSYTTVPNKAVLVVGSNIRELESVLESLKDQNIDVYTHDDMMLAHTFPKFKEYKHLKGQFGQGLENCLLDFATFPGPIVLTKHSLHNIENLYRGRLFTTDYTTSPKGIIKIENEDFKPVIESAKKSRGFKTGRVCETVTIGYDYEKTVELIRNKYIAENYDHIFVIGLDGYSLEQRTYFEKIIKHAPKNVLIISFSYNFEQDNLVYINTCFDYQSWIKIIEFTKTFCSSIITFVPKCDRATISQMIYLKEVLEVDIYVGKCIPILLNPSLISTMNKIFSIKNLSTAKMDVEKILNNK